MELDYGDTWREPTSALCRIGVLLIAAKNLYDACGRHLEGWDWRVDLLGSWSGDQRVILKCIMPPRKYPSGHEKRKKKQRVEALIKSQKGAMDKFFSINNKKIGSSVEEHENLVNDVAENMVNEKEESADLGGEAYHCMNESSNENSSGVNQNEDLNVECAPSDIDDPSNWYKIDQKLRDLLVERGPVRRDGDANFPKDGDEKSKHFSSVHYICHLPNEDKHDRKWLVYSEALNRVFCFCCKLFKQEGNKTQLANEGLKTGKILVLGLNIGVRLRGHESSCEHLTCMSKCIELERRLKKNQTIDKSLERRNICPEK
ncbi:hypothetical protein RHMOL_Rhmol08G0233400 [Rhododendron molle]|uniref:Uncharacterized protein n=1 Tax=Rhododendron molle TaxID=49168 RepID=A0ACC0MRT3_RHOML|nr:hypothetical protein RHMOL_Rhmol08G0233400 [Rhododendron molle]